MGWSREHGGFLERVAGLGVLVGCYMASCDVFCFLKDLLQVDQSYFLCSRNGAELKEDEETAAKSTCNVQASYGFARLVRGGDASRISIQLEKDILARICWMAVVFSVPNPFAHRSVAAGLARQYTENTSRSRSWRTGRLFFHFSRSTAEEASV